MKLFHRVASRKFFHNLLINSAVYWISKIGSASEKETQGERCGRKTVFERRARYNNPCYTIYTGAMYNFSL